MKRALALAALAIGCDGAMRAAPAPDAGAPAAVVFVAFDGAEVHPGACSDAPSGCSFIVACAGPAQVPAYGGTEDDRRAIMAALARFFSPYRLTLVQERPAAGPYTAVVIGGTAGALCRSDPREHGLAPLDCGDANPADLAFVFAEAADNRAFDVAATAAQELAHAMGLEHSNAPNDLMYPLGWSTEPPPFRRADPERVYGFLAEEARLVALDATLTMPSFVRSACDGRPVQSSHLRLLEALGPGEADATPPRVAIAEPADGSVHDGWARPVVVRVAVEDDGPLASIVAGGGVELIVDEGTADEVSVRDPAPPFRFELRVATGPHTLRAVARDAAGNTGESARVGFVEATSRRRSSSLR